MKEKLGESRPSLKVTVFVGNFEDFIFVFKKITLQNVRLDCPSVYSRDLNIRNHKSPVIRLFL